MENRIKNKTLFSFYFFIVLYFLFQSQNIMQSIFIISITAIIVILNFFIIKNKQYDIHKKFCYIAIVFGVLFVFLIPILHGIDEGAHFYKVYSFFNKFNSYTEDEKVLRDEVPKSIVLADAVENLRNTGKILGKEINNEDTLITMQYIGARLYSPISYITYLIPMFVFNKMCNFGVYGLVICGRLISFLCWLVISLYTIKIMPRKKEFMAALCLLPIILTLVTTFTGDLVANTVIYLFFAIWYRIYLEKRTIKKSEIILITLLGMISTCAKMVYALIFLIIFLLPEEKFKSKKNKYFTTISIITIILLTFLINSLLIGKDLINAYPDINKQKEFVINNIFQYIFIFFKTIANNFLMYLEQFTTGQTTMCHNSVGIYSGISIACWIILIMSLLKDDCDIKLNKKSYIFIIGISIIIVSIIFLSLYLQWTATEHGIGYPYVMGVQGRYFHPIAVFLIFINKKLKYNISENTLWTSIILINFVTLLKIILRFVI